MNQEVLLKVIAQVADAVKGLEQVRTEVRSLAAEVKAASPFQFDLQIGDDLAELAKLKAALESTLGVLKQGGTAAVKIDLSGIEAQLKELSARVRDGVAEIKKGFEGLGKIPVKVPPISEKLSAEFKQFQAELRKLETQFQGAVNRLNTASRGVTFDPISRSATLARDKVRIAAENMVEFLAKIPPAVQKDEAAFAALQAKIEGLRIAAERLSKIQVVPPGGVPAAASLTSAIGSLEKAFAFAAAAGQLFFASIIIQKLLDLGKSAVDAASKLQELQIQFSTLLGGSTESAAELDRLRGLADTLGISFVDLADGFRRFTIAGQAAGLTNKEISSTFEALTVSFKGLGLSAEDIKGSFLAFSQILQKSKVSSEELNQQLAERGVPALRALAGGLGKTTGDLTDLLKRGLVPSTVGVSAMAAELLKLFSPAAEAQAKSYRSEVERFENATLDLKEAFGSQLLPVLSETLGLLGSFGGDNQLGSVGQDVAFLVSQFNSLLTVINGIREANLTAFFTGQTSILGEFLAQLIRAQKTTTIVAAEIAESLRLAPKGFADGIRDQVDSAVDKLRGVSKEARKIGEESRKGSDEAGEGVDSLADHWKDLYDGLKKQQKDHQKTSGKSEEEVTKKQLVELKKREDAYKGFFQTLADLAKDQATDTAGPASPATVTAPDVKGGDTAALDALKQSLSEALAAKRELSLQPLTSPEDSARVDELSVKIRALEDQIASYGAASVTAAGQATTGLAQAATAATSTGAAITDQLGTKALAALKDLVLGSADFAKAFAEIGPKAQQSITGIVQGFEQAAASGNVSRAQIEQFGLSLIRAFQQGGLVGQQFAAQLAAAFGTAGNSAVSLAQILRELADGSIAAASSLTGAGTAATATTDQIDRLLVRTDAAAAGFIQAHGASTELKEGIFQVGLASTETSVKVHGVEIGLAKAKENFIGVRDAAGEVGPNLLKVGEGADKAKKGVDDLSSTEPPTKLTEGLKTTADAAQKVVDPIESIAESTAKLGDAAQVEGAAKLGEALTTLAGPAAALAPPLELVAGAASRLSQAVQALLAEPGLGTIESQLTPLLAPLQNLAEPASKLAAALAELGRSTQTIKTEGIAALGEAGAKLTAVVEPAGQAVAALTPVAAAAATLGTNFATLNTNAAAAAAQLVAIGTAATALVTSLGDPALASGLDALGTSLAAASPQLATVATDVDRLSKALEATKTAIPEVATGIDEIAAAVAKPEVKTGLKDLAEAVEKIEKGAAGAGAGLKTVGESLSGIVATAGKAAAGLASLGKALDDKKIGTGAEAVGKLASSSATAATATANLATAADDVRVNVGNAITKLDAAKASVSGLATEATKAGPILRQQLASAFATLEVQTAKVMTELDTIKKDLRDIGTVGAAQLAATASQASVLAANLREAASAAAALKQNLGGVRLPPVTGGQ